MYLFDVSSFINTVKNNLTTLRNKNASNMQLVLNSTHKIKSSNVFKKYSFAACSFFLFKYSAGPTHHLVFQMELGSFLQWKIEINGRKCASHTTFSKLIISLYTVYCVSILLHAENLIPASTFNLNLYRRVF